MFTKRLRRSVNIVRAKGCPFETQDRLLPSNSGADRKCFVSTASELAAIAKTPGQGFPRHPHLFVTR